MPEYVHPNTLQLLTYDSLVSLIETQPLDKQFKAFFPGLTEDNWKQLMDNTPNFELKDMPYQLRIENISTYMEDCKFCSNPRCTISCGLPFCSKMTVLDFL